MPEEVDVVVLGMGPGGEEVAGRLAEAGVDVLGVEPGLVGGECPYWGCVPTKGMVRAGNLVAEARRGEEWGLGTAPTPDWAPVARRVRELTAAWDDAEAVRRFGRKGGRLRRGRGRLQGPGEVVVEGEVVRARRGVVIATGAEPVVPPISGLSDTPYWTNHDAVRAERVPESLIVLGGGAIGVELAQVFRRFGSEVEIVESTGRLLGSEEPEAGDLLATVLADEGITLRLSTAVTSAYHDGARFTVVLDDGRTSSAEHLLVATGRRSDLAALGVDSVGLDPTAPTIAVDGRLRVHGATGLWAVGDVTGQGAFTHVAVYQAAIAARDILGDGPDPADYRALPRVTFTDPEVGAVGETERAARDAGRSVRIGTADVGASARGWIHGPGGAGLIKVVEDMDQGVLVGATSIGPCGGEVLGLLALAVHAAVPVARLDDMLYAYPTFHRAVGDAVRALVPA